MEPYTDCHTPALTSEIKPVQAHNDNVSWDELTAQLRDARIGMEKALRELKSAAAARFGTQETEADHAQVQ